MNLSDLIECCLRTDPNVTEGDYTVLFSGSKSGALNAGVLLFTASALPKATVDAMEYRLVSILMLLVNLDEQKASTETRNDFQVRFSAEDHDAVDENADHLMSALRKRGIAPELAKELVRGREKSV